MSDDDMRGGDSMTLRELHEVALPAPWKADDALVVRSGKVLVFGTMHEEASIALIVALRNAYADGTLVERSELDEAMKVLPNWARNVVNSRLAAREAVRDE